MPDATPLLTNVDDLWEGEHRLVHHGDLRLLVFKVADGFRVYKDRCPHQGATLSDGCIEEGTITCKAHLWRFDVVTGRCENPKTLALEEFETVIHGGALYLKQKELDYVATE